MEQKIIKRVKPDKHTEYMACAQYIDWNFQAFDNNMVSAFIVQEIILEKSIDDTKSVSHYFEAWHVLDGECKKDSYQDSHDLFCIGHPLDDGDALKESIGHIGSISFTPRVFYVEEGSLLYDDIQFWPTDIVKEANGLQACYYTEELAKQVYKYPEFFREPFYHEWRFDEPIKIYTVVLEYCMKMYHRDSKTDRMNFYIAIDDFFPDGIYPDIKRKVMESWENQ